MAVKCRLWGKRTIISLLILFLCFSLCGCTPSQRAPHLYFHSSYEKPSAEDFHGAIRDRVYRNGYFRIQYEFTDPRWKINETNCSAGYKSDYLRFRVMLIEDYHALDPEEFLQSWVRVACPSGEISHEKSGTTTVKGHRVTSASCQVQTKKEESLDQKETWTAAFLPKEDYCLLILSRTKDLDSPFPGITGIRQTEKEHVTLLLGVFDGTVYRQDGITVTGAREQLSAASELGYPAAWFGKNSRIEIMTGRLTAGKIKSWIRSQDKYNSDIRVTCSSASIVTDTGRKYTVPVYHASWASQKRIPKDGFLSDWSVFDTVKTEYHEVSVYVFSCSDHLTLIIIPGKNADTEFSRYVSVSDSVFAEEE